MTYPLAHLDRVVFSYRFHEGNIGGNEELRLTENIRVMQKLLDQISRCTAGARRPSGRKAHVLPVLPTGQKTLESGPPRRGPPGDS